MFKINSATKNNLQTVAIIGSFKQFYKNILRAIAIFKENGIKVISPLGSPIIKRGIPFVRFTTDDHKHPDEMVQSLTLKKILAANAVYVVVPSGYIGRTTCYEVGRVIQSRKPIYFSHTPKDLPIKIPLSHILTPEQVSKYLISKTITWPFDGDGDQYHVLEQELTKKFIKW